MTENSYNLTNSIKYQKYLSQKIKFKPAYLDAFKHINKYGKIICKYKSKNNRSKYKIYFSNKRLNTLITSYNYSFALYTFSIFHPYKTKLIRPKYLRIFINRTPSAKLMYHYLNADKTFKLSQILQYVNKNNTMCYQNKFTHNILLFTNTKQFELLGNIHKNRIYQFVLINKSINSNLKVLTYSNNKYYVNQHFNKTINRFIEHERKRMDKVQNELYDDCREVQANNDEYEDVEEDDDGSPESHGYNLIDSYGSCTKSEYKKWANAVSKITK